MNYLKTVDQLPQLCEFTPTNAYIINYSEPIVTFCPLSYTLPCHSMEPTIRGFYAPPPLSCLLNTLAKNFICFNFC